MIQLNHSFIHIFLYIPIQLTFPRTLTLSVQNNYIGICQYLMLYNQLSAVFSKLCLLSWNFQMPSRFEDDIEFMIDVRPGWYWKITWRFVSPIILLVIFVASLVNMGMKPMTYSLWRSNEVTVKSHNR